jgi:hypothetical protein
MEIGYTKQDRRGRTRAKRIPNAEAFKVPLKFEQFSVQNSLRIEALASQLSVQEGKLIVNSEAKKTAHNPPPYRPESSHRTENQPADNEGANAARATSQAELKQAAAIAAVKTQLNALIQKIGLRTGMEAVDAGTVTTLATIIARLPKPEARDEVLDTLAKRMAEYKAGKREVDKLGAWLVGIAKLELDERLNINVKAAAKGMGMR